MDRPSPGRIVIVGAGLAGASAAIELRAAGYRGAVTLVGDEPRLPYNRPALSKEYLRGEQAFDETLVRQAPEYAARDISLRLGASVAAIDPARHAIALGGGEELAYDRLLVATGGRARRLSVPGAALPGVFALRTAADADAIARAARPGMTAAVVGMGFIGCEIAASLRQLGLEVVGVDRGPAPLASVLGERVGAVLADVQRSRGVRVISGQTVARIAGDDRARGVVTSDGTELACDLVVAGIGIDPDDALLRAAGAEAADGVLVDAQCRTGLPDVYAAGDVANAPHALFGRGRVEHWNNASSQGRLAARAMLGEARPWDYVHSFWSDQFDHSLEYVGLARSWDSVVFRGEPESRRFLGFYLERGRLLAAVGLNRGGDPEDRIRGGELKKCAALIRGRARLDPARLAREDVLLKDTVVG